eukprot:SAG22_NODE_1042_length_5883_cov_129.108575_9_plen_125_part_01
MILVICRSKAMAFLAASMGVGLGICCACRRIVAQLLISNRSTRLASPHARMVRRSEVRATHSVKKASTRKQARDWPHSLVQMSMVARGLSKAVLVERAQPGRVEGLGRGAALRHARRQRGRGLLG